jgi:hypothetical protein
MLDEQAADELWERMTSSIWEALEVWTPNQVREAVEAMIHGIAPAIIAALHEQEAEEDARPDLYLA